MFLKTFWKIHILDVQNQQNSSLLRWLFGLVYVHFLWFSVTRFGVRVSVTFHLTCVHIIFSSVSVAEWPSFVK